MKKYRFLIPFLILLFAMLLFGLKLHRHMGDPVRGDEAAWIFSTVYFTHYSNGDWHHPDWNAPDAIDQPPFAKYYYGIAAALSGGSWKDIADKEWWLANAGEAYKPWKFRDELARRVPARVLHGCRIAAALAALAACMGLFALAASIGGISFGAASAAIFASSGLTLYFVPIVEPDFILLTLILWQSFFLIRWMKKIEGGHGGWPQALAAGLLLGFALDTRLTAALQVPVVITAYAFVLFRRDGQGKMATVQFISMLAAAAATAILLNPTFYDPIDAISRMMEHRQLQVAAAELYSGMGLVDPILKYIKGLQYIFSDFDLIWAAKMFPLGLCLFTIGAVAGLGRILKINVIASSAERGEAIPRASRDCFVAPRCGAPRNDILIALICLISAIWIAFSFWSFSKVLWLRYLLPAMPFLAMAMAYGAIAITRRAGRRQILFGILLFVSIWSGIMGIDADSGIAAAAGSEEVRQARLELILRQHPEATGPRVSLAELYIMKGDYAKARDAIGPAAAALDDRKINALFKVISDQADAMLHKKP